MERRLVCCVALLWCLCVLPKCAWAASPVRVDTEGEAGGYSSLAIVNGHPAISYTELDKRDLKYARAGDADGSVWETPVVVDGSKDVGLTTSLAVVGGHPAISYSDNEKQALKYVRATDPDGTGWAAPVVVDASDANNGGSSLTVVNGHPAISYVDHVNGTLQYVRATDPEGTAWSAKPPAQGLQPRIILGMRPGESETRTLYTGYMLYW